MTEKTDTNNFISKSNNKPVTLMGESTDFTAWQIKLWEDKTVEEISQMAMKRRKENVT